MSRRLLNKNNLGVSSPNIVLENPMEIVKPKPVPVQNYVPNEPIIFTKEQWEAICEKTYDASIPFTVSITVVDKQEEDQEGVEEVKEEIQEPEYVPKKRRSKKN